MWTGKSSKLAATPDILCVINMQSESHLLSLLPCKCLQDARATSIVMKGLKQIALSGRAVCATIYQPSVAIFSYFDSLLILKRGGETIFFGDLDEDNQNLIWYLEQYDATPKLQPGENPATWMLTTIGAGSATTNKKPFNYAESYSQ
jgi:hypothetical protein